MKYDHTELAWAAGLYDGEGCTTNRGNNQPVMSISQSDPYVLERFAKAVGVGKVHGPYMREGKPNVKPIWNYQSGTFEHTQQCLAAIWKWLSLHKRAQAMKRFLDYRNQPTRIAWYAKRAQKVAV